MCPNVQLKSLVVGKEDKGKEVLFRCFCFLFFEILFFHLPYKGKVIKRKSTGSVDRRRCWPSSLRLDSTLSEKTPSHGDRRRCRHRPSCPLEYSTGQELVNGRTKTSEYSNSLCTFDSPSNNPVSGSTANKLQVSIDRFTGVPCWCSQGQYRTPGPRCTTLRRLQFGGPSEDQTSWVLRVVNYNRCFPSIHSDRDDHDTVHPSTILWHWLRNVPVHSPLPPYYWGGTKILRSSTD